MYYLHVLLPPSIKFPLQITLVFSTFDSQIETKRPAALETETWNEVLMGDVIKTTPEAMSAGDNVEWLVYVLEPEDHFCGV